MKVHNHRGKVTCLETAQWQQTLLFIKNPPICVTVVTKKNNVLILGRTTA